MVLKSLKIEGEPKPYPVGLSSGLDSTFEHSLKLPFLIRPIVRAGSGLPLCMLDILTL